MIGSFILLGLFPLLCIYACFSDLFTMRISNRICLAIAALFPFFAVSSGMDVSTAGLHVLTGLLVLFVSFSLFATGWIGGGDAKLVAAIGVWVGFGQLWEYVAISSILGGALTIALLSMRQHPLPAFAANQKWLLHLHDKKTGVPYGIALGVASLVILPHSDVWRLLI
jgi:prepilin peptidase CpaA